MKDSDINLGNLKIFSFLFDINSSSDYARKDYAQVWNCLCVFLRTHWAFLMANSAEISEKLIT